MSAEGTLQDRSRGVSLGILAADPAALRAAALAARGWGADILHFDVMDGVFVPGITAGPAFVAALDLGMLRDVHLMVQDPARQVPGFADAGADIITVHAESDDPAGAIAAIRAASARLERPILAGLALMPGTTLQQAAPLLALAPDMVLLLAVDPRKGKALDIAGACAKLAALRGTGPLLAFDGGVTLGSIGEIAACAPDMVVSGSAILGAADPAKAFADMAAALGRE